MNRITVHDKIHYYTVVIPAKAGNQRLSQTLSKPLDPGFRRGDGIFVVYYGLSDKELDYRSLRDAVSLTGSRLKPAGMILSGRYRQYSKILSERL